MKLKTSASNFKQGKVKLKTLKDMEYRYDSELVDKVKLKKEAIKWVKEDLKLLEILKDEQLRKIALSDMQRWMERLNITEGDLK